MELINDKKQVACFQLGTLYDDNDFPHFVEINFDNDFLRYNYIRKLEKQLKDSVSYAINDVFIELKKNNITIDLATEGLTEFLREISEKMFDVYSAISYSLDDYDFTSQELLELANVDFNLVMAPAYKRLETFYSASNDIEQYYEEVDAYRKRVGGFGFGITGFVKSQIVAGAINMTADKLHDIFVTPANQSKMNRDIKELGLTLVNDTNFREEIHNAFSNLIDRLNYAYFTYLSRKELISNKNFYDYHYENDEKVSRYLDNSLSDGRNTILEIVDICTSSIEQSPYNPNLYFKLIAFLETYNIEKCERGEEAFNTDEVIKIMNYLEIYEDYRKVAEESGLGQKGLRLLKEPKDYEDVVDGCRVLSHIKFALKYDAIAGIMGYITQNQKQANQGSEIVEYTSEHYEEISEIYLNELLKGIRFSGLNSNDYLQNFFYGEKFFDTIKSAELGNELAFTISTYMFVMPTICRCDNEALQKSLTELIDKCIDSIVMDNIYEKYLLSLKAFVVNKNYSDLIEQLDSICDDNVNEELSYESSNLISCIQSFAAYLNFINALKNTEDNNLVMAHFSSSVMYNSYFSFLDRVSIADGIIAGEYGSNRIECQMISLGGILPDRYEELVATAEDLKRTMDIILSEGYSYRATGKVNKSKLTLKAFNLYNPDKAITEDMLYLIDMNCQNAIKSSVGAGVDPYIYLMEEFVSENIVDVETLAKKKKIYVAQYSDSPTMQQQAYQVADQYLEGVLFVAKPYMLDREGFVLCKDCIYFRHDSKKVQHAKLVDLEKITYNDTYNRVVIERRYGNKLNVKVCNDHFFSETIADFINEIINKMKSGYLFVKNNAPTENEQSTTMMSDCDNVQEKSKTEKASNVVEVQQFDNDEQFITPTKEKDSKLEMQAEVPISQNEQADDACRFADEDDQKSYNLDANKACENKSKNKLSEKTWFVILLLIIFWPVGLFFMWKHKKFNMPVRIIVTIVLFATVIFSILPSDSDDIESDSGNIVVSDTFGFTDEAFIEWANNILDGDYIISDGVIMDVEGDNYYRIVNRKGEDGVILLAHEVSSGQVTAIGVGFEDVDDATDVACKFGTNMASSFSYEDAYNAVMGNTNYTAGGMIVYKMPSGEDKEMVVLFTTAYHDTLLESNDESTTNTDIIEIESVEQLVDSDEYLNQKIKVTGMVNYEDPSIGTLKMYGAYSDLEVLLEGSEEYSMPESGCVTVIGVAERNEYGETIIVIESLEPCVDQDCAHNEVYY